MTKLRPVVAPSPADTRAIGLRYSRDDQPGIRRRRHGDGWRYETDDGTTVHEEATLDRIRKLAVPPAWTDVWICADEHGHLQATGRDARGRKQYRYHREFRARRESAKFEQLIEFGLVLPRIRAAVAADLARPGLPREKVLAACVRVLELTLMRVGNDEYAEQNRSFGLTTLRDRHARIAGSRVRFRFRGKGGKLHEVGFRDRRLGAIVRRCQELPGQELFQYIDEDGVVRDVASDDVNEYLRAIAGADISAKMFRTWAATVLANRALTAYQATESSRVQKRNVAAAMEDVAALLGNTPTVARQSYVHPAVLDAYLDGSLGEALVTAAEDDRSEPAPQPNRAEEERVIELIRRRLADDRHESAKKRTKRRVQPRRGGRHAGTASRPRTPD